MRIKFIQFSCFFLALIFCVTTMAADEKYNIDPQHSFIVWRISHLGFSTQTGKFPINGVILLNKNDPAQSKVDVNIKINDMMTGIPELNKHLEGSLFFDSEKYPTASFISQKIKLLSKETADVTGTLTLHGVSKLILLHVMLNKMAINPITDKPAVGFSADTTINRSDFNIKGFLPMVGDKVHLNIDVEAQKAAS